MAKKKKIKSGRPLVERVEFGQRITDLRVRRGLSQGELAEAVGVGQQSVSAWETGARVPGLAHVRLLAETLRVRPAKLFG